MRKFLLLSFVLLIGTAAAAAAAPLSPRIRVVPQPGGEEGAYFYLDNGRTPPQEWVVKVKLDSLPGIVCLNWRIDVDSNGKWKNLGNLNGGWSSVSPDGQIGNYSRLQAIVRYVIEVSPGLCIMYEEASNVLTIGYDDIPANGWSGGLGKPLYGYCPTLTGSDLPYYFPCP